MTPKEKGTYLINEFYDKTYNSANDYDERFKIAKQCALIAVDEILNAVHIAQTDIIEYYEYWEQVKQEIEKHDRHKHLRTNHPSKATFKSKNY